MTTYHAELTIEEWWKLPAFIAAHQAELTEGYCRLSEAIKNDLQCDMNVFRKSRIKIVHLNPKALQKQVNAMFNSMEKEWMNITSHTGVEGFYVAVCGDVEGPELGSKMFCTEIRVLGYRRLCAFHLQNSLACVIRASRRDLKHKLSWKKIKMNYDNYEWKIVETYRIELDGWTYKWVLLSEEELAICKESNCQCEEQGNAVYKCRKITKKASNDPRARRSSVILAARVKRKLAHKWRQQQSNVLHNAAAVALPLSIC
ncbi:hypothetical protein EDD22DRAFT_845660 [Suillus occidentalis]|nr:hypothetical protein EDD22DRAFT_845660 [Suillus occidentalis]